MATHCFTSITYNYMPRARVLAKTLKANNPNWLFHLVVSEPNDKTIDLTNDPFDTVVFIQDLGIIDFSSWLFKHDVTEVCTAIKGRAFEYIINKFDAEKILYLDPDIAVYHDLCELEKILDESPIVFTPHQTMPNMGVEEHYHDNNFLRCGVFNLGFLALHNKGQGKEFLDWWQERINEFCYDESPHGLFTDQRWCDLAPSYFDKAHVLRDAGYNVAAWNLSQRALSRGDDGALFVNKVPLRFFHFSRYGGLNYEQAAKENSLYNPVVCDLVDWYKNELERNGQKELGSRTWFYDRFNNGERITRKMRKYYRQNPELAEYFPDPFDSTGNGGFHAWWKKNDLDAQFQETTGYESQGNELDKVKVSSKQVEELYDKATHTVDVLSACAINSDEELATDVSILIPFTQNYASLVECVSSIIKLEKIISFEILIVAHRNNSMIDALRSIPKIKIILTDEMTNMPRNCNKAAKHATGRFFVVIESLSVVRDNWLAHLKNIFSEFPDTGMACSKLIDPVTFEGMAGLYHDEVDETLTTGRLKQFDSPQINFVQESDFPPSCMMLPASLWEAVGGMNVNLPDFVAFLDLAVRIHDLGYKIRYQPRAEVVSYRFQNIPSSILKAKYQYPNLIKRLAMKSFHRRISSKGNILYVDDRIPEVDQSAGGLYSFNCIRILLKLGFNVTFIPAWGGKDNDGYKKALQSLGSEVFEPPYISGVDHLIEESGFKYDLVVLCRPLIAHQYTSKVKKFAPQAKVVFNTIDLHFLRLERLAQVSNAPNTRVEAQRSKEMEIEAIQNTDATIVVSDVEQMLLQEIIPSANISLIPIPVDIPGRQGGFDGRSDLIFLGGYRHTPNVDALEYFLNEIWPVLSSRMPSVKFIVAGSNLPDRFLKFASETVIIRGFVNDLADLYAKCRLSVVPLRVGAGVKGKILTSLGFGVPNVVTSIAAEGMRLTNGKEVLIADTPESFAEAVEKAYTQPDLWLKLSNAGLDYLRKNSSMEAVSLNFKTLLESINLL